MSSRFYVIVFTHVHSDVEAVRFSCICIYVIRDHRGPIWGRESKGKDYLKIVYISVRVCHTHYHLLPRISRKQHDFWMLLCNPRVNAFECRLWYVCGECANEIFRRGRRFGVLRVMHVHLSLR